MRTASSPPEGAKKTYNIMLAAAIISLVLSLVAVAMGVALIFHDSALSGEVRGFKKGINNDIAGLKQAVNDLEKQEARQPWLSYDERTRTVTVYGNISATGWVASGGVQDEGED